MLLVDVPDAGRTIRPLGPRLVVVSTFVPRRCGLASYTEDLCSALSVAAPPWQVDVCALDRDGLRYPPPVRTVIRQDVRADYREAADAIADQGADVVLIQHEYGIFGGADGDYVIEFADRLRERGVPLAVTLHTVLGEPTAGQASVLTRLCAGAARVTVFTDTARRMLLAQRVADPRALDVVPHGAPAIMRTGADQAQVGAVVREVLADLGDAPVLSTFGLLGPRKGLDVAIRALPSVVERHPAVRYLIAGTTHPDDVRDCGGSYSERLADLARELGVAAHVRFVEAFLTESELAAMLARTDLYLTPYRTPQQAGSGPLTFAVAAGCPVVSTRYRYAEDLLAPGPHGPAPGLLVPCEDAPALAAAIGRLLDDPAELAGARRAAETLGATLLWPAVAARLAWTLSTAADDRVGGAIRTA